MLGDVKDLLVEEDVNALLKVVSLNGLYEKLRQLIDKVKNDQ